MKTFAIVHNNGFEPTENYFDFVQLTCFTDAVINYRRGASFTDAVIN